MVPADHMSRWECIRTMAFAYRNGLGAGEREQSQIRDISLPRSPSPLRWACFPVHLTALKVMTGLTWEEMSVHLGVDPRQLNYWRDGGWPNWGTMLTLVDLSTRVPCGLGALLNND